MSGEVRSGQFVDTLRLILVREGKIIFDSEKEENAKPKFEFSDDPLKFCPRCGGATIPVIFMCKDCGQQYVQQIEKNTKRKIVIALEKKELSKDF